MHIWALGLSCETPAAPPDPAAGARTRQPENSKRAHFTAPALQTPPKFHERTPRERRKKIVAGKGKKARNFGPPTLRGSTLRGSTLWGSTLRGPPFGAPPFGAPLFLGLVGPPPSGASTLRRLHPSGPQPSGPPPFGASTLRGPTFSGFGPPPSGPTLYGPKIQHPKNGRSRNWPKSKLAEVEIGRSRNWPKSNWPNSKKKAGRSRNWPKSIAL